MQKIDKRIIPGTKVLVDFNGRKVWDYVVSRTEGGTWVKLKNIMGSHQAGHIYKFKN